MNTNFEDDRNISETPIFDPFPEPQTMPSGWDMSGIVSPFSLPADTDLTSASEAPFTNL